jgi:hypothetical protein
VQIILDESEEAEDRRDLSTDMWEGKFWASYNDGIAPLTGDLARLRDVIDEMPSLRPEALRDAEVHEEQEKWENRGVAVRLEMVLAGSTAFWMTVGLLAAWALRPSRATENGIRATR